MATREAFLARTRRELDGIPPGAGAEGPAPTGDGDAVGELAKTLAAIRARCRLETEPLLSRFEAEAQRAGVVTHRAASIARAGEIVHQIATAGAARRVVTWNRRALGLVLAVIVTLKQAGLEVLEAAEAMTQVDRERFRDAAAAADIGLTVADLAIAETGSLVLASGAGRPRSVSVLPPCHVALFGREHLIGRLDDGGVWLAVRHAAPPAGAGANVVLVTGPSRTADIELTLTRGVHGPRDVHAVFVESL